jgi:adhesin HecA-like repeat protein
VSAFVEPMQLREGSFHGPRPTCPEHPKQRVHRHGFYVRFENCDSGNVFAGHNLSVSTQGDLDNANGHFTASGDSRYGVLGTFTNASGAIATGNNLAIDGSILDNRGGSITAGPISSGSIPGTMPTTPAEGSRRAGCLAAELAACSLKAAP